MLGRAGLTEHQDVGVEEGVDVEDLLDCLFDHVFGPEWWGGYSSG